MDPKRLVAAGYNVIADTYAEFVARSRDDPRHRDTTLIRERFPSGSRVLELGCGSGVPTKKALAERFVVSRVDLSAGQIERARRQAAGATFVLQPRWTANESSDDPRCWTPHRFRSRCDDRRGWRPSAVSLGRRREAGPVRMRRDPRRLSRKIGGILSGNGHRP